jgi:ethanolamine utilization protein EutA (predicted chaperonin)
METNKTQTEQLTQDAVSKSLIEIIVRSKKNETRGSIHSIKKLLKNEDLAPFYLVKVTGNDEVIYIEETSSNQIKIELDGEKFKLSFVGQFLAKDIAKVFEMLNADVYLDYGNNQASNNSDIKG